MAGIIEKSISMIVLRKILVKKENKNLRFQYNYMLTNEAIDFFNSVVLMFLMLTRCGNYCPFGYTYWAKLYEMIFFNYISNALLQCQTFLEITFCN